MNSLNLIPSNFSTTIRNPDAANIIRDSILANGGLPDGIDPNTVTVKATRGGFIVTAEAIQAEQDADADGSTETV